MPSQDHPGHINVAIAPNTSGRHIRQAMILAAGLGERMRPLTDTLPKPMLPIAERPIIDRIIDDLERGGIERVVVNTFYLPDAIEDHLSKRSAPEIVFSREETRLETGGGILNALDYFDGKPFFVINGDTLWLDGPTPTLDRLETLWDADRMDALLLLHETVDAYGYDGRGDFTVTPEGLLARRPEMEITPYVFTGTQIVQPAMFDSVKSRKGEAFSMNILFDHAIAEGRLHGIIHDGEWFHIGTPDGLEEVEEFMRDPFPGVEHRST